MNQEERTPRSVHAMAIERSLASVEEHRGEFAEAGFIEEPLDRPLDPEDFEDFDQLAAADLLGSIDRPLSPAEADEEFRNAPDVPLTKQEIEDLITRTFGGEP